MAAVRGDMAESGSVLGGVLMGWRVPHRAQ
jgi:hypothetical protein